MKEKRYNYENFNPKTELSWIDYSGLLDAEVDFVSELGRIELSIEEILKLTKGSIIDLKKPAGGNIESYINGHLLGKGEVIVSDKNLAVRINEILDPNTVLDNFAEEKR